MKPSIADKIRRRNHPVRAGVAAGRARVVIALILARSAGDCAKHNKSSGKWFWVLLPKQKYPVVWAWKAHI